MKGAEKRWTAWVCPDCDEHVTEQGHPWGHYHDPPEDWPGGEDPWFDAEKVAVVRASEFDRLKNALEQLQMGPDTLTQAGLRIVIDALYPTQPDSEHPA